MWTWTLVLMQLFVSVTWTLLTVCGAVLQSDIYRKSGSKLVTPFKHGRGTIRISPQEVWPPSCRDSAASFQCRRLWQIASKMVELEKRPTGYKASQTWSLLIQPVTSILDAVCSTENARQVRLLLDSALVAPERGEVAPAARLENRWLRQDANAQTRSCFNGPDGQPTANAQRQFDAVRQAWR